MLEPLRPSDPFLLLRIPFAFLAERARDFDLRADGNSVDLHISAKRSNWLHETRGRGVALAPSLVQGEDEP